MWFENLMGFRETGQVMVHENVSIAGEYLSSKVNGKRYKFGILEIPTLEYLRKQQQKENWTVGEISFEEIVGNVQDLHGLEENKGALFQAASQFNLLEMVNPNVTPEKGVGIYEQDFTQGPACAIACGAGTIYRNYFVPIKSQIGQTEGLQIDCLSELAKFFDNENKLLWKMRNGYALANKLGLEYISTKIEKMSILEYEALKGKLKIGLQWNTEVTFNKKGQTVSQAYCSALPVAYSQVDPKYWKAFSKLVLEATYEATFLAALKNYKQTGNPRLFLTLVGGGVFGNEMEWIFDAIGKAINLCRNTPLEVKIVSYGQSNWHVQQFIKEQMS